MKKVGLILLVLVLFSAFVVTQSEAGQLCWNWSPFLDIIKVSTTSTLNGHTAVNGFLTASGFYFLPVIGTFEKDPNGLDKRLSLHMTNNTTFFGGFRDCVADASLSRTSVPKLEGPVEVNCGAGGFVQTGTLVRIDCSTLAPLSQPTDTSTRLLGE